MSDETFAPSSFATTTMSEEKLPEEILREILRLALFVSPDHFCQLAFPPWQFMSKKISRASRRPRPHAGDVLLVSRRWLRIGTPLLYEFVSLSDPSHSQSVARLLKSNPTVGKAVRYLRLEGGLGKDLITIAQHTTGLHTLYVCLYARCTDSVAGISKAFPLFRPAQLYVFDPVEYGCFNKNSRNILQCLETSIAGAWTSLVRLRVRRPFYFAD